MRRRRQSPIFSPPHAALKSRGAMRSVARERERLQSRVFSARFHGRTCREAEQRLASLESRLFGTANQTAKGHGR